MAVILLLDLSAEFDTINDSILSHRLESKCTIRNKALLWIKFYLANRNQTINIQGTKSDFRTITFGVTQGSILGLVLLSLYSSPLADFARRHNMYSHFYADDYQLYLAYRDSSSIESVETCIRDIDNWMTSSLLKLNNDKLRFFSLVFHINYVSCHIFPSTQELTQSFLNRRFKTLEQCLAILCQ